MSNLNVDALKRLFPKNTTRRQGGKVDGANRKRVQVMLPPDTLARLDELIEHDQQARSAAVALGVEVLYAVFADQEFAKAQVDSEVAAGKLLAKVAISPYEVTSFLEWVGQWCLEAA